MPGPKAYRMFETEDFLPKKQEEERELSSKETKAERTRSPLETPQENVLETRENVTSSRLDEGINETFFIELKDDGSGIFKPGNGEDRFLDERHKPLRKNVEAGTYFLRERAAYLVDRFLGFDMVPPTVIRTINGVEGSFQQFVPNTETLFEKKAAGDKWERRSKRKREEVKAVGFQEELLKLWIFDYIIYNSDRHWGNFLLEGDEVHAIDNGLSFGPDKIRRTYGKFWDTPVSDAIRNKFEVFLSQEDKQEILRDLLSELLKSGEAEACLNRIKMVGKILAEKGEIPASDKKKLKFSPE